MGKAASVNAGAAFFYSIDKAHNFCQYCHVASILPSAVDCCDTDSCDAPTVVSVPGPPGPTGPTGPAGSSVEGLFIVDTLFDARATPVDATNSLMFMLGSTSAGDGFGGVFRWDASSNAADDYDAGGGTTINPSGNVGPGRWVRFF